MKTIVENEFGDKIELTDGVEYRSRILSLENELKQVRRSLDAANQEIRRLEAEHTYEKENLLAQVGNREVTLADLRVTLESRVRSHESPFEYRAFVPMVALRDLEIIAKKDAEYGGSWKKRGGQNAFFMMARKWDRLEEQLKKHHFDIFEAGRLDCREEGVVDDIGDLRRYLILIESEITHLVRRDQEIRDR